MDVSRSGRIRKKSSKLADSFTDEAEIDSPGAASTAGGSKSKAIPATTFNIPDPGEESPIEDLDDLQEADYDIQEDDFDQIPDVPELDNDEESVSAPTEGAPSEDADEDEGNLVIDDTKGRSKSKPAAASSIYLAEKRPKPGGGGGKSSGGGKSAKARKDKGRPRFTAYMLWAKANREKVVKEIGAAANNFAVVSKRLSDKWSSVPMSEKYLWKKKASKLSFKIARQQAFQARKEAAAAASTPSTTSVAHPKASLKTRLQPAPLPTPVYKVTGIEPLDCAAHLKLLGESLSVIGSRLKERDGQIAVAGSLSVLLDSMLCAMAPLMCVTQQVPQMENSIPRETLNQMLDNIAYIIPGL